MGDFRRITILFIFASLFVASAFALGTVNLVEPTVGSNLSGTITLNATTDTNATNVTFVFRYVSNGSIAFTTVVVNDTTNDTVFDDASFDTTSRPDGIYNVTANATNGTVNVVDSNTNVTIDNTAPTVAIATTNDTNTTDPTPTIEYSVTDALSSSFSCSVTVDGSTDAPAGNASVLNGTATNATLSVLGEGAHTYNVTCTDASGNTDTSVTNTITFDETVPTAVFNTPQSGANFSNETIELNATVTDATAGVDTVVFEVLDASPENISASATGDDWTASLDLTTVDEGLVTIRVWANDSAGNMNDTQNVTITVDRTAPNVVINTANDTNTTNTTPTIEYTVDDSASGSFSCTVTVDGSADGGAANASVLNATATNATLSTLGQGAHTYNVTCTDNSGNSGASATNTITVDTIAPTVTIDTPQSGANFSNETIDLNATVSDATTDVTNVTFEVLNATAFNRTATESGGVWTFPLDLTSVDEGSLTIKVWAYDAAGNLNNTENVTITVDRTAPGVTITSPSDGANVSGGIIDLNATVTDSSSIDSVVFEIDDGTPTNITAEAAGGDVWNATLNVSNVTEGTVTIRVYVNDTLGNANSTQSVTITVDSTEPIVTIESAPFNTTVDKPQIDFNVTDNLADPLRCELFMNGTPYNQTNAANATSISIQVNTSLIDGSYEANVTCTDDAGNIGVSGSINIVVDTVRPAVTFHTPLVGNYSDEVIVLNVTATDALSGMSYVNFTISDGTPDEVGAERNGDYWNASLDLSTVDEGTVTIIARAYDTAGNNNITENVTIVVDQTVPTITVHEPTQDSVHGSMFMNVTFNGTGTGINTSTILFTFENSTGNYSPNYGYENLSCVSSNSGKILDCNGTFSLDDDAYNIGFGVNDTSSNYGVASTNNVTVNSAVPNISYDSSSTPAGTHAQDFIFINVTASVSAGSIDTITLYRYDDGSLASTDTNDTSPYAINHTGLADGTYIVNGTVNDTATNIETLAARTYTLDTVAPSVAIDNASFNTTDTTPTVFFTASDATAITCELFFDSTSYNTTSVSNDTSTGLLVNATLTEGDYTVNVTCTDAAGNNASDTINVTIDTTSPAISYNTPAENASSNETNLTINVTVTGSPDTVAYRVLNGTNTSEAIIDWTVLTQNGTAWNATINLSALTEWNYSIEVRANDSLNNTRVSTRMFLVDRTAPSASVTCSNVNRNAAQSCTCTATDNSDDFGGSTSTSTTSADTSSTGTKSVTCTATDLSGLTGTGTDTYEVSSSSSGGSSGGGGGSYTSPSPSAKKSWVTVEPGTRVEITIDDDEIPIKRISILVGSASSRTSIEVEKLDRSPVPVDFDVYEVFDILALSFLNTSEQTIEFTVPTTWIRERGLQPGDVSLFRHVDGEWIELETRRMSLANEKHRYEAKTPGFSFFAIGTTAVESEPTDTVTDESSEPAPDTTSEPAPDQNESAGPSENTTVEPEQTEETPSNNAPLVLIIGSILGVIFLAVAAWFIFGRHEKEDVVDHRKTAAYDEFMEHSKEHASEIDRMLGLGEDSEDEKKTTSAKSSKKTSKKSSKDSSSDTKKSSKTKSSKSSKKSASKSTKKSSKKTSKKSSKDTS